MAVYEYNAQITRVIDASTMVATIDLGFSIKLADVTILLADVVTKSFPDLNTAARLAISSMLPYGAHVRIHVLRQSKVCDARLCNVWIARMWRIYPGTTEETNMSEWLVKQGYAIKIPKEEEAS